MALLLCGLITVEHCPRIQQRTYQAATMFNMFL